MKTGAPGSAAEATPYLQLKTKIKDRIVAGSLKPGDRIPPVRSLAAQETISPATVQRALRELVQEGFLVSRSRRGIFVSARQDAGDRLTVGLLMSQPPEATLTSAMHGPLFQELQHRLVSGNMAVVTMQCVRQTAGGRSFVPRQVLAERGLRAVVLLHVMDLAYIASLVESGIPVLTTDVDASDVGAHSVIFDNLGSAFELTSYLLGRGHRRILFLGGMRKSVGLEDRFIYDMAVRERSEGFRLAMQAHELDADMLAFTDKSRAADHFVRAMKTAIKRYPGFTAVVGESPQVAVRCLRQAGMEHVEVAGWTSPARGTQAGTPANLVALAACDFAELGERAHQTLLECLAHPGGCARRVLVTPHVSHYAKRRGRAGKPAKGGKR